jgi:hypothetical protein
MRSLWHAIRWPLIATIAVLTIVLGYVGFDAHLHARGITRSFWDKFYLSLQLFGLQSGAVEPPVPAALGVARILAPAATFYAAVAAIVGIFREQLGRARVRWFARDHVVVCGLGRAGELLARGFRERGFRVVALEIDRGKPAIGPSRDEGIAVLAGDATDPVLLAEARVDRARYLFAVSGDDAVNAKVAVDAGKLVRGRHGPALHCFVRVLDGELAELLETELPSCSPSIPCSMSTAALPSGHHTRLSSASARWEAASSCTPHADGGTSLRPEPGSV